METFEIIKNIRTSNHLTQSDFGRILKCDRYRVADIERGKTTPTIEDIKIISKEFNISSDYLLGISDVQSTDTDVKMICEYTGLSEYSVDVLRFFNGHDMICKTINTLLESQIYSVYQELGYFFVDEPENVLNEQCERYGVNPKKVKEEIVKLKQHEHLGIVLAIERYLNLDLKNQDKILSISESGNIISLSETNADYAKNINLDDLFSIQTIKQSEIVERVLMDNIVDKLKKAKKMLKEQKAGETNGNGN